MYWELDYLRKNKSKRLTILEKIQEILKLLMKIQLLIQIQ